MPLDYMDVYERSALILDPSHKPVPPFVAYFGDESPFVAWQRLRDSMIAEEYAVAETLDVIVEQLIEDQASILPDFDEGDDDEGGSFYFRPDQQ